MCFKLWPRPDQFNSALQECIADGLGDVLHAANGEATTAVANPPVTNVPWSNFDGTSHHLNQNHFQGKPSPIIGNLSCRWTSWRWWILGDWRGFIITINVIIIPIVLITFTMMILMIMICVVIISIFFLRLAYLPSSARSSHLLVVPQLKYDNTEAGCPA